jgi:RNA polymerase sigma factor for flagellar operon FliA
LLASVSIQGGDDVPARTKAAPTDADSPARAHAPAVIATAWQVYKGSGVKSLRNWLAEHYLPLLDPIAHRLRRRLPAAVDLDDLKAQGLIGLLSAIESFDLTRQTRFEHFAKRRIRGEMIDWLRMLDPVSRGMRRQIKQLESAGEALRAASGQAATPEELSEATGLPTARLRQVDAMRHRVQTTSLSGSRNDESPGLAPHVLADPRAPDPAREAQARGVREALVRGLDRAERLVILLYYYEGLTMREIGAVLDLSEGRVCQIHKNVCARLRATLAPSVLLD